MFFQNDIVNPPPPPNNPASGALHGSVILATGTVSANNIFDDNYGWGMFLDSPGSESAVDILFNDLWMNDQQANEGLCSNCNAECNDPCTQGAPPTLECDCQFPGRTTGNLVVDPTFAVQAPVCSGQDNFLLKANSPLHGAGLALDANTFVTAPYRLYHQQLAVDVGFIDRDGLLAPSGPATTEAREVASHSAVHGSSSAPVPVRIITSPVVNEIDLIFFTFAGGISDTASTFAMKFDFMGANPTIHDGDVELTLVPEFESHIPIQLAVAMDGDKRFDTLLDSYGEIDPVQGTVRFSGVDLAGLQNKWLIGIASAPQSCREDVSGDGEVNAADLAALLGTWGPCAGCAEDLVTDGMVNSADLEALLNGWGLCP